jgi:hypothetical protein
MTRHITQEDYDILQKAKKGNFKELTDGEMDEICRFLNQSRISWSGNEFVKEAMRMALRKAQEK